MATTHDDTVGKVRDLTFEEGYDILDRLTREELGMSAREFVDAWNAGAFDDDPDQPTLMHLVTLIPLADPATYASS